MHENEGSDNKDEVPTHERSCTCTPVHENEGVDNKDEVPTNTKEAVPVHLCMRMKVQTTRTRDQQTDNIVAVLFINVENHSLLYNLVLCDEIKICSKHSEGSLTF